MTHKNRWHTISTPGQKLVQNAIKKTLPDTQNDTQLDTRFWHLPACQKVTTAKHFANRKKNSFAHFLAVFFIAQKANQLHFSNLTEMICMAYSLYPYSLTSKTTIL